VAGTVLVLVAVVALNAALGADNKPWSIAS
jgi:hypothetical protein